MVVGSARPAAIGLRSRVRAGGDHVTGVAEHVRQRLLRAGQPARDGDLGAVQHHVVGQIQRRPDQAERHGGSSTTNSAPIPERAR
jgi:hypothetical protein